MTRDMQNKQYRRRILLASAIYPLFQVTYLEWLESCYGFITNRGRMRV